MTDEPRYEYTPVSLSITVEHIVAFDSHLTDYDVAMVNGYLLKQWGEIDLPHDHPYEVYSRASRPRKAWLRLKAKIRRTVHRMRRV